MATVFWDFVNGHTTYGDTEKGNPLLRPRPLFVLLDL